MNFKKFFLFVFPLCFLPSLVLAGTAHYVDCNAGTNGNGSSASPWNNIPSVNSHSFSTGDDVYFKVNTTCTLTADSDRLQVDWSGTSNDRVTIGCYDGNGDFDCGSTSLSDGNRPIIDGDNNSYPGNYHGTIEIIGVDYVTVQDLKIQYYGNSDENETVAIKAAAANSINVDNCYFYRGNDSCILYTISGNDGVDTGVISNNYCENAGYPNYAGTGAAITVTGSNSGSPGTTTNITVHHNEVFSSKHEGIGIYKKATNCTVEYNTVYDIRTFHIYISQAAYNTVRYNLVYNFDGEFSSGGYGISIDDESFLNYTFSSDNEIYGNLVAGLHIGIGLGCQISQCTGVGTPIADCKGDFSDVNCFDNSKVYNNTLVDNEYSLAFFQFKAADTLEVKNNISYLITDLPSYHIYNDSPAGVTWSHNLFYPNSIDTVGGNAVTNAIVNQNPQLEKTSGWRSLTAGSLDGTEFRSLSGSKAINAGISIPSYNNRIKASEYTADPITVTISNDSTPDIGAWMKSNSAVGILPSPTDLTITAE